VFEKIDNLEIRLNEGEKEMIFRQMVLAVNNVNGFSELMNGLLTFKQEWTICLKEWQNIPKIAVC
jgi:hypothetical protein